MPATGCSERSRSGTVANGADFDPVQPLRILKLSDHGRIGLDGLPGQPPLLGPDGRYFGHEWARWRYDTLDQRVDDLLRTLPNGAVLDVGCASGARAGQFAAAGFQVTGLDIVDHSQSIATRNRMSRDNGGGSSGAIAFLHGDLATLSVQALAPSFDLIHARRVLSFVAAEAFDRCFATLDAATKPGGLLVASFISSATSDPNERMRRSTPGTRPRVQLHHGLYAHYPSEVRFALEAHGFFITELFSDGLAETGMIARKPVR